MKEFFAKPEVITILYTLGISLILAFVLGILLGFFKKVFHVEVDPKIQEVRKALPGANCGGCGYPGCDGFAAAFVSGDAEPNGCVAGGSETAKTVSAIMGSTADAVDKVSVIACQGASETVAKLKGSYLGVKSCMAAKLSCGGTKVCDWSCIGFGDCQEVCPFGAIKIGEKGLPVVDYEKCTGCGICVKHCPQKVLSVIPQNTKGVIALCSNRNPVKPAILKGCSMGCLKCGKCEKLCPKGAIKLTNGIPVVDYTLCDSCNKCVEGCPTKVLALVENVITKSI